MWPWSISSSVFCLLHSVDQRPMGASQEEETEWERKKEATERGRERCVGGGSAVMWLASIHRQNTLFAGRCGCYHWGDRKEVGGLFALNFNSIRRKASHSGLRRIQSRKIPTFFSTKIKALSLSPHVGEHGKQRWVNSLRYRAGVSAPVASHLLSLATLCEHLQFQMAWNTKSKIKKGNTATEPQHYRVLF